MSLNELKNNESNEIDNIKSDLKKSMKVLIPVFLGTLIVIVLTWSGVAYLNKLNTENLAKNGSVVIGEISGFDYDNSNIIHYQFFLEDSIVYHNKFLKDSTMDSSKIYIGKKISIKYQPFDPNINDVVYLLDRSNSIYRKEFVSNN